MGNTSEAELDGVDDLMDHHFAKIMMFLITQDKQKEALTEQRKTTHLLLIRRLRQQGPSIPFFLISKTHHTGRIRSQTVIVIMSLPMPNRHISLTLCPIQFSPLQIRLRYQQPRDANRRQPQ
jgi:hypothetical protein